MLSLIPDCIKVILSFSDYISTLQFSYTSHSALLYRPPKRPTDQILFEVIKSASLSLYNLYDNYQWTSVWNYVLSKPTTLVYIAENLDEHALFSLKSQFPHLDLFPMLEFAVLKRSFIVYRKLC